MSQTSAYFRASYVQFVFLVDVLISSIIREKKTRRIYLYPSNKYLVRYDHPSFAIRCCEMSETIPYQKLIVSISSAEFLLQISRHIKSNKLKKPLYIDFDFTTKCTVYYGNINSTEKITVKEGVIYRKQFFSFYTCAYKQFSFDESLLDNFDKFVSIGIFIPQDSRRTIKYNVWRKNCDKKNPSDISSTLEEEECCICHNNTPKNEQFSYGCGHFQCTSCVKIITWCFQCREAEYRKLLPPIF